ncbi:hypothetical protein SVAN01_03819 [Stagonosporopsis vannaccii]|nr:hypothetical protein SVAN01_03819 [Stagonosporopsis vannaccii]
MHAESNMIHLSVRKPLSASASIEGNSTIAEAIDDAFLGQVQGSRCENCASNQTKTRRTKIVAAPKILRIQLQILRPNEKIFHALTHPDQLDLTASQEIAKLPLRYELSSVLAHAGDYFNIDPEDEDSNLVIHGHYIASVREPSGTFSMANDSYVRTITHDSFLTNPQRSGGEDFQIYVLTYIRDDSERLVPRGRRWVKELIELIPGGGVGTGDAEGIVRARRSRVGTGRKRGRGTDDAIVSERQVGKRKRARKE